MLFAWRYVIFNHACIKRCGVLASPKGSGSRYASGVQSGDILCLFPFALSFVFCVRCVNTMRPPLS